MSYTLDEAKEFPSSTLRYKGVFDYNALSTFIIKWFLDRHFEIDESTHKHKMSCPHGFEIQRDINAWRRIDDFRMYKLRIFIHLWDAFEVDAVKDGKQKKLWDARMEILLGFEVVMDYSNRYENNPWMKKLLRFYCEYVIKKETIAMHADPLYYKSLLLHEKIKEFLEMDTTTHFEW
ncbi:hypothetical protein KY362_01335 [Candidatus Woesearchaeota archaeon]|nr:hypothetical protein [Candidatus Woesearchaeota archaeon]